MSSRKTFAAPLKSFFWLRTKTQLDSRVGVFGIETDRLIQFSSTFIQVTRLRQCESQVCSVLPRNPDQTTLPAGIPLARARDLPASNKAAQDSNVPVHNPLQLNRFLKGRSRTCAISFALKRHALIVVSCRQRGTLFNDF